MTDYVQTDELTGQLEPPGQRGLLEVTDLGVDFPTEDEVVHAVRRVSFSLNRGEVLGVVGESGSGKSVSAMAILGLLPRSARLGGSIRFSGEELIDMPRKRIQQLRGNDIAMIFQDPMTALNPVYTVGWQLSEAYRVHHNVGRGAAWAKAVEALELVGIPQPDRRAKQYPHEFSGGMRQRAVIAMSIINDPELIIADEPTTALDVTVQAQILETMLTIRDETGAAIMMITHDLGVIAGMADRVQVMYGGTIVESGTVEEVFERPRMPYTVGLMGSIPNAATVGRRLTPIVGAPPSLSHLPDGCVFSPRCPLVAEQCTVEEPELVEAGSAAHHTRCVRWTELVSMSDPKKMFVHSEIGNVADEPDLELAEQELS